MTSRIPNIFNKNKSKNKKTFISYLVCGDPSKDITLSAMHTMSKSGVDIIELGIPFSDPMADGPVIQRASERALANNVGIRQTIELAKEFRTKNKVTPIILMGYANPIEAIGVDNFVKLIKDAEVDGVITVDYPPEESVDFVALLKKNNIDSIFLLSPTTKIKEFS